VSESRQETAGKQCLAADRPAPASAPALRLSAGPAASPPVPSASAAICRAQRKKAAEPPGAGLRPAGRTSFMASSPRRRSARAARLRNISAIETQPVLARNSSSVPSCTRPAAVHQPKNGRRPAPPRRRRCVQRITDLPRRTKLADEVEHHLTAEHVEPTGRPRPAALPAARAPANEPGFTRCFWPVAEACCSGDRGKSRRGSNNSLKRCTFFSASAGRQNRTGRRKKRSISRGVSHLVQGRRWWTPAPPRHFTSSGKSAAAETVDLGIAGGGLHQPQDHSQRGRLAGPRWPPSRPVHLAGVHGERQGRRRPRPSSGLHAESLCQGRTRESWAVNIIAIFATPRYAGPWPLISHHLPPTILGSRCTAPCQSRSSLSSRDCSSPRETRWTQRMFGGRFRPHSLAAGAAASRNDSSLWPRRKLPIYVVERELMLQNGRLQVPSRSHGVRTIAGSLPPLSAIVPPPPPQACLLAVFARSCTTPRNLGTPDPHGAGPGRRWDAARTELR